MSRFLIRGVVPYVPGEQPAGGYLKLNTNESPFPPSPRSVSMAADAALEGQLYPDPECKMLCRAIADDIGAGVKENQVLCANGSDAILNYAFAAFCGEGKGAVYADLTYGFYSTLAGFYGVPSRVMPLRDDYTVNADDYIDCGGVIFLPNPNAPTGLALDLSDIERIVSGNDNIVIIDEAYVDFGTESAVSLIDKYDNLLVTRTFSKSRSLAGARLGFAVGNEELIGDLRAVKYSIDPY